jgi:hypothetical protein
MPILFGILTVCVVAIVGQHVVAIRQLPSPAEQRVARLVLVAGCGCYLIGEYLLAFTTLSLVFGPG